MSVSNLNNAASDNQEQPGNIQKLKKVTRFQFEHDPSIPEGVMWDEENGELLFMPPQPQQANNNLQSLVLELLANNPYKTSYLATQLFMVPESINRLPQKMDDLKTTMDDNSTEIGIELNGIVESVESLNTSQEQTNILLEQILSEIRNEKCESGTAPASLPSNRPSPPSKPRIVQVSPTMKHVRDLTKAG